jgi:hypothetical protein
VRERMQGGRIFGDLRRTRTYEAAASPLRLPSNTVWTGRQQRRLLPVWVVTGWST